MDFSFIDKLPGYVTVVSLDLTYLAINKKFLELLDLKEEDVVGKAATRYCGEMRHLQELGLLINSPVGTEQTWEYNYDNNSLLVCSRRECSYIISQASSLQITKQELSLLRYKTDRAHSLLSSLKELIQDGDIPTATLRKLTSSIIDSPEENNGQGRIEKIEVLIKGILAIAERSESHITELKQQQTRDDSLWKVLEGKQADIERVALVGKMLLAIPGGTKTLLLVMMLMSMLSGVVANVVYRHTKILDLIPSEIRKLEPATKGK